MGPGRSGGTVLLAALLLAALPACRQQPIALDKAMIVVDDGDTIHHGKSVIRVAGIDTPEIAHAKVGLLEDQPFGREAKEATEAILARAVRVEYLPSGRDRYGRILGQVFVDGELLAVKLLEAGLAYETVTTFGDGGYPDLAQEIMDAARRMDKPGFEPPWKWREKQRRVLAAGGE